MNDVQLFNHEEFGGVRVVEIDGQTFFVGTDVAAAIGYADGFGALKKHVDGEDKLVCQIDSGSRGLQNTTVINESGVYSLILRSDLPKAKEFKRWVTSEVLPSIRKHGIYATDGFIEKALANPDFAIKIFTELKEARAMRDALQEKLALTEPKVRYYDNVLQCSDLVTTQQIAKDYGMSAKAFNQLLKKLGIQFRAGRTWHLYQKYACQGWSASKTYRDAKHCRTYTCWTQQGREGLYEFLLQKGILPVAQCQESNWKTAMDLMSGY